MNAPATSARNGYVFAVVAVVAAAAARWLLDPLLGNNLAFLTFYIAVAITAWYHGGHPALFATLLGAVAAIALFVPSHPDAGVVAMLRNSWKDWLQYFILAAVFAVFGESKRDALARAEVRRGTLQVTLSSIGDGVIATDVDGNVTSMNPIAEGLTGWKQRDAIGLAIEDVFRIVHEDTRANLDNPVATELEQGRRVARPEPALLIGKDGAERSIDDSAAPIRSTDGKLLGAVLIFRDVTDVRKAERTLRLAHDELDEANHALREADQRKDEFLVTLAQELRNPLASLRNGLQVMRLAGADVASIDRARGMMERQMTQIIRLVDDLLDVHRIGRGKFVLKIERVNLIDVVQHSIETCLLQIEQQQQKLSIGLPASPIYLDADSARLSQAVSNLLLNAAKFTPKGGDIRVEVSRSGSDALISVEDSGIGIPSDQLEDIFTMFTQVERDADSQTGLGIGLTVVRRLVEMHGGTVQARSSGEGKGSEFVIRLPVAATQAQQAAVSETSTRPGGKRRVLIADDNEDAAASLALMLNMMGNETRTTLDGLAAIDAGPDFSPDVVLLDIAMPNLNGYDTARRIRGLPWGKQLMLVALTGRGRDEDRRRSHEAGFDFHLVKPVDPTELEQLLGMISIWLDAEVTAGVKES